MRKTRKLKLCNRLLLIIAPSVLTSSIHLEITGSRDSRFVRLHIALAALFVLLAAWHISLHFQWKRWFSKFKNVKSPVTRALWWFFLATAVSAVIALAHWLDTQQHSPIGGLHGKMGLAMIILSVAHFLKRIKFFRIKR